MRRTLLAAAILLTSPLLATAAISLTNTGYSESFDGLPVSGSAWLTTSSTINAQIAITQVPGWQVAKIAGTGVTNFPTNADAGVLNSGGLYSYGAAADSDRALGVLASGSNTLAFGAEFVNASGGTINTLVITFTAEQWRSSTTTTNSLPFMYALGGGAVDASNFLSAAGMTALTDLNALAKPFVAVNGATNGNDAANQTIASASLTGLNWAPDQSLFIRWSDTNDAGNDAGVAIDTFTVAVPEPTSLGIIAVAGLLALRRNK